MKLLITGFDPFGGEVQNPSWEAVRRLPDRIGKVELVKLQLPTVFGKSLQLVREKILACQPQAVISVGQAGGRPDITVERMAINLMDAGIPDNEGNQPVDQPIEPEGDTAYFSTLPIKEMVRQIQSRGIQASISNSAGCFVCNSVMYGTLYTASRMERRMWAGFIHLPYLPEQVAAKPQTPSMPLERMTDGLAAAAEAVAQAWEKEENFR